MALRVSKALRNFINAGGSLRQALNGGKIKMFTGAQPTLADDAEAGTLLVTFTKSGSAHTAEVLSTGTIQLTGGASGNVSSLKVNAIEILNGTTTFNTSLTQTAADIARDINRNPQNLDYVATSSSTVVTVKGKPGLGALPNGYVTTGTSATITLTHGTFASGVTPVNGLNWEVSTTGTMVKRSDETWQGTAVAGGTAGWFRWIAGVADAGSADSLEAIMRLDGAVATSGSQLNASSTTIALSSVQTISADQIVIPPA